MRDTSLIPICISALAILTSLGSTLATSSAPAICDDNLAIRPHELISSEISGSMETVSGSFFPLLPSFEDLKPGGSGSGDEAGMDDEIVSVNESGSSREGESELSLDHHSIRLMMELTGISALHRRNITGKGVTIAILDSQFYYDNETAKKLTRDIVPFYNDSYGKYEVHGIACAELISEIAPDVKLYLVDAGNTEEGVIDAVDRLLKLDQQIDIVSCSSDFPFGRFDGEDDICEAIEKMTAKGALWINSAGNQARCHWSGEFNDPDGNGFHNFSPEDESINLTLERGDLARIWLSWEDDWDAAAMDYDLRLDHPVRGHWSSDNLQKGYRDQMPLETIYLAVPEDGIYYIKIRRYDDPGDQESPVRLTIFTTQDLDEHLVQNSSIGVMGSCPAVITVGAINISTMEIQPYSSRGPTGDGRRKPDLVAPDNVTTFSYISDGFAGTSASAPYVAGCAALIMEAFKNDPNLDVKKVLMDSATDLGPRGPDDIYGYGLVNLSNLEVNR
ncbi:MAG TPA: S8 family serine peptidase [Methanothrix sp.]|nr:S8 family serine peptidase [Methanothrix sp.]